MALEKFSLPGAAILMNRATVSGGALVSLPAPSGNFASSIYRLRDNILKSV